MSDQPATVRDLIEEFLRSEFAPQLPMDWLTAQHVLQAFAAFVGPDKPAGELERRDSDRFLAFVARRRSICPEGDVTARRIVTAALRTAFLNGHFG